MIGDVSTAALHDEAEYEVGDLGVGVYLPRPITLQITASSNN